MAAHPTALLPRLHRHAAFCIPVRTCLGVSTVCEQVCQDSSSKSSAYAPFSCSVSLHDVWSAEARASESSRSQAGASVAEDFGLRKASAAVQLTGTPDEAFSLSQRDSSPSAGEDSSVADKFTRTFTTDAPSNPAAGRRRLQSEDGLASEARHADCCVPVVENVSTIPASSDDVDVSQSALASSSQTRSKVVRTAWEALVRWSRSWRLLNARKATDSLQRTKKVVVIGGGSFGTAMAVLLARNKSEMHVSLLVRDPSVCESINNDHINRKYFPKHILPHNIVATIHPQEAFKDSEYCIHAVPVQYSADFLKSISEHVPPSLPFFSVSKGLELTSLEMMSQVIPRALCNQRQPIAVISGPSFSIELMDELPTAMVVASKDKELARTAQQLFASHYLRINTSSDVVGVEIAGALKNVLAIAAGIVEGMKLGNNCMAALVAQGCCEIRWLAEKMGAKSTTLAGLSGTGDIMLTCFVNLSRNRSLGVRLGSGEALADILSSMNQVAEGVPTAGAVIALARKYRVQMPVLTAVARILENELTPKRAVLELMSLPQVEEV